MARPEPYKWRPKNPQKYKGDHTNIWSRSSWETRVFIWLDNHPNVISWSSEEIVVPYVSPVDGRWHRYFVDACATMKTPDGRLKTYLLEVKPKSQTIEPKIRKRVTKGYITEVTTWAVNQAKFKAAVEYCLDRGWEFKLITEYELGLL